MTSSILLFFLGLLSAGLILAGVAFYIGWEAHHHLQRDLEKLLRRPRGA